MANFDLIYTLITIVGVMAVMLGTVAYLILAERKISAWVQDRIGPNRVGPFGLIQPIVDGIKMFLKEEVTPKNVDKLFFFMAPAIAAGTALLSFALVPFGGGDPIPAVVPLHNHTLAEGVQIFDEQATKYADGHSFVIAPGVDIGILWSFAIGSLAVYGIILGGWSANNKYALLGALRSSAQIISYEIPLGMSIIGVVLLCGSFNLENIINWQANNGWLVLYQPLAFLLFMTAVFAECNRLPFDLPEAEQELVGGYHTEYSSMKFGLFFLGEYTHMITTSFLMAILFFGGWHFPGLTEVTGLGGAILKIGILAAKVTGFIIFYMLVRWTIPRFRFDQLMSIAWQVLIPLSILNMLCVMTVKEFAITPWILPVTSVILFFSSALITTQQTTRVRFTPATERSR